MDAPWYTRSFRRNLIDMHISDFQEKYLAAYDPETYAQNLARSKVDTAILYAGSCLGICYFPTRAGYMHKNLHGRDILGETVAACRRRGLRVVIYFNIWSRWAYDTHPQWRMRDADGLGYSVDRGERFGQCCPNTGYRDYVREQISQLVSDYDCDGLWIDMIGWFSNICYCDGCRERFRRETGRDLPETIDWNDETWRLFQEKREDWFTELAALIRETATGIRPDITVTQQCSSWSLGWVGAATASFFEQSDYLAGDFYQGGVEQSVICKYLNNVTVHKPIEFMVSRCSTLEEHTTTKPMPLLAAQRYSALANNAAFVFIDAIDPEGTVDSRIYDRMGALFEEAAPLEKALDPGQRLRADVALFLSQTSMADVRENGEDVRRGSLANGLLDAVYAMGEALIEGNIAFDVVSGEKLNDNGYKVLVVSDAAMLSAEDEAAIRRFVREGGALYASKGTSLYRRDSGSSGDFTLADVLGVSARGETAWNVTYLTPAEEGGFFGDFNARYPLSVSGTQQLIEADPSCRVLATLTLPDYDPRDLNRYAGAISSPPAVNTGRAAMTEHVYGRGRAIYAAAAFERSPHPAHREVFCRLLRELIGGEPAFTTDAPAPAEVLVYDREAESRLVVNLLNFQKQLPPVPLRDTHIAVRLPARRRALELRDAASGEAIPFREENGYAAFIVPACAYLASFLLDYGE